MPHVNLLKYKKLFGRQIRRKKYLFLLLTIIALAAFVRVYHLYELAIFRADQAIMSEATVEILRGHFTLLGPSASVGPFFFGPIVYYLMAPFYFIFSGHPIAGTVFQATLQISTIPFIFLIGKQVKDERVGIVAAFIFSCSALLVEYSRQTFNTTTALFFSTLVIYLFLRIILKDTRWWIAFLLGIFLGWTFQMNFITVSLLIAVIFFPFFFYRQIASLTHYVWITLSFIVGFSPYILFELRHNFFNTHAIFNYIFHSSSAGSKSVFFLFSDVPSIVSQLLYGFDNFWLGIFTILVMIATLVMYVKKKKNNSCFNFLLFLIGIALVVSLLYGHSLIAIYLIAIQTTIIILFSMVLLSLFNKKLLILILSLIFLLNAPNWNLQKPISDLQDGISMGDFQRAALIIKNDNQDRQLNVAMLAQGDNRAIPLRYFLYHYDVPMLSYKDYSNASYLYLIIRQNYSLKKVAVWEYLSFGSNEISKTWEINNQYTMYKLHKQ